MKVYLLGDFNSYGRRYVEKLCYYLTLILLKLEV